MRQDPASFENPDPEVGAVAGWLDMSRYPNLDPDRALEPEQLSALHDFVAHTMPDLPPEADWDVMISQAFSDPPQDDPGQPGAAHDSAGPGPAIEPGGDTLAWDDPGETWDDPGPASDHAGHAWPEPGDTWDSAGDTWDDAGHTWDEPGHADPSWPQGDDGGQDEPHHN